MLLSCTLVLALLLAQELWSEGRGGSILKYTWITIIGLFAATAFYQGSTDLRAARYFQSLIELDPSRFFMFSGILMVLITILMSCEVMSIKNISLLFLFIGISYAAGGLTALQASVRSASVEVSLPEITAGYTGLVLASGLLKHLLKRRQRLMRQFPMRKRRFLTGFLTMLGGIMIVSGVIGLTLEQESLRIFQPWRIPEVQGAAGVLALVFLVVIFAYWQKSKQFR
jgi:hypothetical protein